MLSIRDTLQLQRHKWVDSKSMEKINYASSNQKRAAVVILLSDKIDIKTKIGLETKDIL